jgi:hypothetical protein
MRTLRAVLDSQKSDALVLAREFTAVALGITVTVHAVLERTAVVYQTGHVDEKRLVKLEAVLVPEASIRWVPRNPRELQQLRARQLGQVRGRLRKGRVPA